MSVYAPLRDYLQRQKLAQLELSFSAIEQLTGRTLPKSARRPQFWANVSDHIKEMPARKACREGGYDSFLVKDHDKLRLLRI